MKQRAKYAHTVTSASLGVGRDADLKLQSTRTSMIDPASFKNVRLHGGFVIADLQFTAAPMLDALEREAVAQTRIIGRQFRLLIQAGLSERELSLSLYHEILEAATVGSWPPPASVLEFNEADFEQAAQVAHEKWGDATPERLNHMLQSYGFLEE